MFMTLASTIKQSHYDASLLSLNKMFMTLAATIKQSHYDASLYH